MFGLIRLEKECETNSLRIDIEFMTIHSVHWSGGEHFDVSVFFLFFFYRFHRRGRENPGGKYHRFWSVCCLWSESEGRTEEMRLQTGSSRRWSQHKRIRRSKNSWVQDSTKKFIWKYKNHRITQKWSEELTSGCFLKYQGYWII